MYIQRGDAIDLSPGQAAQADAPPLIPAQRRPSQTVHAQEEANQKHCEQENFRTVTRQGITAVANSPDRGLDCHSEPSEEPGQLGMMLSYESEMLRFTQHDRGGLDCLAVLT